MLLCPSMEFSVSVHALKQFYVIVSSGASLIAPSEVACRWGKLLSFCKDRLSLTLITAGPFGRGKGSQDDIVEP